MKRMMTIILLTLLIISILVGCNGKTPQTTTGAAVGTDAGKSVDYPKKTIKLICPWTAGGGSDQICRAVASVAEQYLGVSMVVENRDGSGGTIGITEASRAPADGYTVVLATTGVFLTQPLIRDVNYTLDSFKSVAMVSTDEICICVAGDNEANDMAELADLYKGKQLKASGNASGSLMELLSYDVYNQAKIDVNMVAYSGGAAECIAALLGGEVEAVAVHPYEVGSNVAAGTIKMLGVTGSERQSVAPDTKTFAEQGIKTSFRVFKGFFVPEATDPQIVEILSNAFGKIFEDEEFLKFAKNIGLALTPATGAEVKDMYQDQLDNTIDKAISIMGTDKK